MTQDSLFDTMKNFILDVDGVIETGKFLYSKKGKEYKIFGPHDADGLNIIKDKVNILFISSDKKGFPISKKRITDMGYKIKFVPTDEKYDFVKSFGFENTIYMGDGFPDAPIIRDCEFGIAPRNARIETRRWANYVTPSESGEGAVCDACIKIDKEFFRIKKTGFFYDVKEMFWFVVAVILAIPLGILDTISGGEILDQR